MSAPVTNALADYVPWLRVSDDDHRLRIVLHDFGLVWHDSPRDGRPGLVTDEPERFDQRWDALLAAYVEHRCWHDDLSAPDWVFHHSRYLSGFWYPGRAMASLRVEAVVHSPAAFEVHGVLLPERELMVV